VNDTKVLHHHILNLSLKPGVVSVLNLRERTWWLNHVHTLSIVHRLDHLRGA
jgi:hypothetical protein